MASIIKLKRRIGATGAPTTGAEGEVAIAFAKAAGSNVAGDIEVWAHDGVGWIQANPKAAAPSVGIATLPGGTAGSSTGIGAAWTALSVKPTDPIIIATFAGSAYVKTGTGGNDSDWTSLGSSTSFASAAEILAGTEKTKAINSLGLQSRITAVPDNTPANDARKLVMLDAAGKINSGFLPPGGLNFAGSMNLTQAYTAPAVTKAGTVYTNSGTTPGALGANWDAHITNLSAGAVVNPGDMIISDGTDWHHVGNTVVLSDFVSKTQPTTMAKTAVMTWTAPTALTTVLDGADNSKSQIESFNLEKCVIDGGTYS